MTVFNIFLIVSGMPFVLYLIYMSWRKMRMQCDKQTHEIMTESQLDQSVSWLKDLFDSQLILVCDGKDVSPKPICVIYNQQVIDRDTCRYDIFKMRFDVTKAGFTIVCRDMTTEKEIRRVVNAGEYNLVPMVNSKISDKYRRLKRKAVERELSTEALRSLSGLKATDDTKIYNAKVKSGNNSFLVTGILVPTSQDSLEYQIYDIEEGFVSKCGTPMPLGLTLLEWVESPKEELTDLAQQYPGVLAMIIRDGKEKS